MQQISSTGIAGPYHGDSINFIYKLIFCDDIDLFKTENAKFESYPWRILMSHPVDIPGLKKIIADVEVESRCKLLAYDQLRKNGTAPTNKELLGVIVEIGLDEGLDVLASFRDGSARYINQTEKLIIWDAADETSTTLTNDLFAQSERIVSQIGPWDKPKPPAPVKGKARISFLVSDGLYFGEAPIDTLFSDPLAAGALHAATKLLQYLTEKGG